MRISVSIFTLARKSLAVGLGGPPPNGAEEVEGSVVFYNFKAS
jgi:hypothetical protein